MRVKYIKEVYELTKPKTIQELSRRTLIRTEKISELLYRYDPAFYAEHHIWINMAEPSYSELLDAVDSGFMDVSEKIKKSPKFGFFIDEIRKGRRNMLRICEDLDIGRRTGYDYLEWWRKEYKKEKEEIIKND